MSVDIILVIQVHSWCNTTSCVESAETLQIYSTTIYIYIFFFSMESMDNCRWKVRINVTHIHTFNPITLRVFAILSAIRLRMLKPLTCQSQLQQTTVLNIFLCQRK